MNPVRIVPLIVLALAPWADLLAQPASPPQAATFELGAWVDWKDFAFRVERYETPRHCRGGSSSLYGDGPAPGAKLVYVWLSVRNRSDRVLEPPSLMVELSGIDRHDGWFAGTVCRYDDEALGNACYKGSRIYPGVQCGGWVLFEVPAAMRVDKQIATVLVHVFGEDLAAVGGWLLGAQ